ncbi:MAG: asparaginase domain-containing protein [Spirochaeta sp.]|nr:asparaginase domain-containing protein [Spirochaeta sp.]
MSGTKLNPVRIIITGGTFDKDYDELSGALTFRDTHLPEILRASRITVPVPAAQDPALGAKSIVLTGAMLPYTVLHSDAAFNLGFALAAAQLVACGIHLCMNGRVFAWDNARKNTSLGIFEAITPDFGATGSATPDSATPDFGATGSATPDSATPEKDST